MGIPIFYMELAIGQRLRKGPLHVWNKLNPYLAGVGLSSVVVSFLVGCYYNMIVAWCFYYLFISFQAEVPYAKCPCAEGFSVCNATYGIVKECRDSSPTTYYWYNGALGTTTSIDDSGVFNWKLSLCLLLAWIVIFAITSKGTESMGKVKFSSSFCSYFGIEKIVKSFLFEVFFCDRKFTMKIMTMMKLTKFDSPYLR